MVTGNIVYWFEKQGRPKESRALFEQVALADDFPEFLTLPEEVLTTTMIHHQHNFPVVDEHGRLKPAFLAVTNTDDTVTPASVLQLDVPIALVDSSPSTPELWVELLMERLNRT